MYLAGVSRTTRPTHSTPQPPIPPVTSRFQVHEDWGPERLASLGTPDKQFIRHGKLLPRNGHPALPSGHCHSPRSVGMAVRRDVGVGGGDWVGSKAT